MTTRTIYVAIDGNEFDDQYKCEEYEKEIIALRQHICDIKFFDKDMRRLPAPFIFQEKYEEILDNIYGNCEYVEITDYIPREVMDYITEIWGWEIPDIKGTYHYDWDNYEWIRET